MTAEQWETCRSPAKMCEWLRGVCRIPETPTEWVLNRVLVRKMRLFGVACVRATWVLLTDGRLRTVVEAVERCADDPLPVEERMAVFEVVHAVLMPGRRRLIRGPASTLAALDIGHCILGGADNPEALWRFIDFAAANAARALRGRARGRQANLMRCVFGNPFRPPVTINPAALAFKGGAVVTLARSAYIGRDPSTGELDATRLAILFDALEEAGVDDRAALDHLRKPGPHCRGCHVVDAVLGRS